MPPDIRGKKRGRPPKAATAAKVDAPKPKRKRKPKSNADGPRKLVRVALIEVEDIVKRVLETHRISPWLETEEAAKYLGKQPGTLRGWRSKGEGPPFHVVNHKFVRYHVDDLDRYVRGMSVVKRKSTL